MNSGYEFICKYCGNNWRGSYVPQLLYCTKCQSKDDYIRVLDLSRQIDYYEGCPPFKKEDWNSTRGISPGNGIF